MFACACVRACVCVRVCACARVCVPVCMYRESKYMVLSSEGNFKLCKRDWPFLIKEHLSRSRCCPHREEK